MKKLSDTLLEIDVPLAAGHFSVANDIRRNVQGRTVIDVTFHQLAHHSPKYVSRARQEARNADIVFFSHPWVYPVVHQDLDPLNQIVVYDSQNVEAFLRYSLLDDGGEGTELVREVARIEHELCHRAHRVLACSHEDRLLFHKLYSVPFSKIVVMPNGTFTNKIKPVLPETKKMLKERLGLRDGPLAIFLASAYPPNIDAANFILMKLAPQLPDITFAICGGVGAALDGKTPATVGSEMSNVIITGTLNERDKLNFISAADIGINPMFSGSGTNIKMLDFMAAGLPVVSTTTGARGIDQLTHAPAFRICESEGGKFAQAIKEVLASDHERSKLERNGRRLVEENYSWERLSSELGIWSRRQLSVASRKTHFTVVVASYERHDLLCALLERLEAQTFKDFEVVIVDQSPDRWPESDSDWDVDVLYIHSDVRGAVNARNKGVFYSRGDVIAFIDDDCLPEPQWLERAAYCLRRQDIIGIEGFIKTDRRYDPNYRTVTNEGFAGLGFMTANLFLRTDIFNRIGGFDGRFDHPHFREDTDLAWRALEYGTIPFLEDVAVYHPPHRRSKGRESHAARVKFFEKDPLLLQKHPRRYKQLFLAEGHWQHTEGFWENFFRGGEKYGVDVPEWCLSYFSRYARGKVMKRA
jgi:glycosyltransferase involved in cell wall biosynthesis/GT2 family glycosyltransferase